MSKRMILSAFAASAILAWSSSASAAILLFDITGTFNASFELDSALAPDIVRNDNIFSVFSAGYNNIPIIFNGMERMGNVSFGRGLAATFNLNLLPPGPQPFTQLLGPDLFSGSPSAPVFNLGNFGLRNGFFGQNVVLKISQSDPIAPPGAIPEPTTWAIMIAGFGLVGSAIRRRRRKAASVRLA